MNHTAQVEVFGKATWSSVRGALCVCVTMSEELVLGKWEDEVHTRWDLT